MDAHDRLDYLWGFYRGRWPLPLAIEHFLWDTTHYEPGISRQTVLAFLDERETDFDEETYDYDPD